MGCKKNIEIYKGREIKNVDFKSIRHSQNKVRQRAEYRKAVLLFEKGNKISAQVILEALCRHPELTPSEVGYIKTQIARCTVKKRGVHLTTAHHTMPLDELRDCGPRALALALRALQVEAPIAVLVKAAGTTKDVGTSLEGLVQAAKSVGSKATGVQLDRDALAQLDSPAVAWWHGNHFVAVLSIQESAWDGAQSALIHDPNEKEARTVSLDTLLAQSGGILLVLKK